MFLINADRYNMSPSYLDDDISRDSPISMCLPSLRGRGLCALLMANFLIEKQNNLLVMCRERVEPKPRYNFFVLQSTYTEELMSVKKIIVSRKRKVTFSDTKTLCQSLQSIYASGSSPSLYQPPKTKTEIIYFSVALMLLSSFTASFDFFF